MSTILGQSTQSKLCGFREKEGGHTGLCFPNLGKPGASSMTLLYSVPHLMYYPVISCRGTDDNRIAEILTQLGSEMQFRECERHI